MLALAAGGEQVSSYPGVRGSLLGRAIVRRLPRTSSLSHRRADFSGAPWSAAIDGSTLINPRLKICMRVCGCSKRFCSPPLYAFRGPAAKTLRGKDAEQVLVSLLVCVHCPRWSSQPGSARRRINLPAAQSLAVMAQRTRLGPRTRSVLRNVRRRAARATTAKRRT